MKYLNSAQRLGGGREIMLTLIDCSPSMDATDYQPSRRQGAIEANRQLIEAKAERFPNDRIGIIAFSGNAVCVHPAAPAGETRGELCRSLKGKPSVYGGTNFCAALDLAEKQLFGSTDGHGLKGSFLKLIDGLLNDSPASESAESHENITRQLVLLTDGEHTDGGNPVKIASRLKDTSVVIECVGIAGSPDEVDEKMLKRIASLDENGEPRYCFIGDTSSLIRKYKTMANQIRVV
jgi:hypothetical protein